MGKACLTGREVIGIGSRIRGDGHNLGFVMVKGHSYIGWIEPVLGEFEVFGWMALYALWVCGVRVPGREAVEMVMAISPLSTEL